MKRNYSPLTPRERRTQALDEAFFTMPDGPQRSAVLAFFNHKVDPTPAAREWLEDRGILEASNEPETRQVHLPLLPHRDHSPDRHGRTADDDGLL